MVHLCLCKWLGHHHLETWSPLLLEFGMTSALVPHIDKVTNCQSGVMTDGLTAGPVCCSFSQASSCLSMGLH